MQFAVTLFVEFILVVKVFHDRVSGLLFLTLFRFGLWSLSCEFGTTNWLHISLFWTMTFLRFWPWSLSRKFLRTKGRSLWREIYLLCKKTSLFECPIHIANRSYSRESARGMFKEEDPPVHTIFPSSMLEIVLVQPCPMWVGLLDRSFFQTGVELRGIHITSCHKHPRYFFSLITWRSFFSLVVFFLGKTRSFFSPVNWGVFFPWKKGSFFSSKYQEVFSPRIFEGFFSSDFWGVLFS